MYYCTIQFQIDNDLLAYIVVESDNRDDCLDKLVTLFRDVWSQCTGWHGAGGMMEAILLAQEAGHTVYPGAGAQVNAYFSYKNAEENTRIARIVRYYSDGGDDFIECGMGRERVFGFNETRYRNGTHFNDANGTPDFAALAELLVTAIIDAAGCTSCTE